MIWAFEDYRQDEAVILKYHHGHRGHVAIEIGSDMSVRASLPEESWDFYVYHGWLMWAAWGILGFF